MGAQAQPSRPQPAGSGVLLALLVAVLVVVIAAGTGVMAYEARYRDRIYAGVSVLGVPVGGLEPAEALERVGEVLAGATLPVVVLHDGVDAAHASNRWTVGAGDLGAHLDLESALREAWAVGRSGIFRHDMAAQARALWWGYDVVPPVKLEPGTVALTMRRIAGQAGYRARPAQLRVTSLQAVIGEGQAGREVDLAASYAAIEGALRAALGSSAWGGTPRLRAWAVGAAAPPRLPTRPVAVALAFRDTLPVSADLGEAEARVDALLSAPLILTLAATDGDGRAIGRRWAVDQATLAAWIDVAPADDGQAPGTVRGAGEAGSQDGVAVQVGIDREQVTAYLARIAEEIARPPREPRFDYDPASQTLTLLAPEQSGLSLDAHLAAERVIAAWSAGQHEVALPVTVVEPRVTRAALQALMPLELISEGVSSFVGSSAERLQNIRVAT